MAQSKPSYSHKEILLLIMRANDVFDLMTISDIVTEEKERYSLRELDSFRTIVTNQIEIIKLKNEQKK